jgi:hypothetical protein
MSGPEIMRSCIMRFNIFVLLMLAMIFPVSAQNYFFENYGFKQGLIDQKVYTVFPGFKTLYLAGNQQRPGAFRW